MTPRPRAPRPELVRALRALGAATVLVLLLGQLASVGHYVFVAHYLCAEHGTLHHGRPPALSAPRQVAVGQAVQGRSVAHHDSHDECAFPAREHQRVATLPGHAVEPAVPSADVVVAVASADSTSGSIPLLSLAPKQSPPAAI